MTLNAIQPFERTFYIPKTDDDETLQKRVSTLFLERNIGDANGFAYCHVYEPTFELLHPRTYFNLLSNKQFAKAAFMATTLLVIIVVSTAYVYFLFSPSISLLLVAMTSVEFVEFIVQMSVYGAFFLGIFIEEKLESDSYQLRKVVVGYEQKEPTYLGLPPKELLQHILTKDEIRNVTYPGTTERLSDAEQAGTIDFLTKFYSLKENQLRDAMIYETSNGLHVRDEFRQNSRTRRFYNEFIQHNGQNTCEEAFRQCPAIQDIFAQIFSDLPSYHNRIDEANTSYRNALPSMVTMPLPQPAANPFAFLLNWRLPINEPINEQTEVLAADIVIPATVGNVQIEEFTAQDTFLNTKADEDAIGCTYIDDITSIPIPDALVGTRATIVIGGRLMFTTTVFSMLLRLENIDNFTSPYTREATSRDEMQAILRQYHCLIEMDPPTFAPVLESHSSNPTVIFNQRINHLKRLASTDNAKAWIAMTESADNLHPSAKAQNLSDDSDNNLITIDRSVGA
ncbi:MAG: hypothetical protein P0S94_00815 [Simkaniaceae bacterium]|nr:hypothetical protein [Simkaniaceae bacterium]